jgi:hypothetical protein
MWSSDWFLKTCAENQFFISNTGDQGPLKNRIAEALVERILRAASEGKKFRVSAQDQDRIILCQLTYWKVIVCIPEVREAIWLNQRKC